MSLGIRRVERVSETSETVGTGAMILGGASTPVHKTFHEVLGFYGPLAQTFYLISNRTQWESGIGTLQLHDTNPDVFRMDRDTVVESSAGLGISVNFLPGRKLVTGTVLARDRYHTDFVKGFRLERVNATDLKIHDGICRDDTDNIDIQMKTTNGVITKELDRAWSAGDGGGGHIRGNGVQGPGRYNVWVLLGKDLTVDYGVSTLTPNDDDFPHIAKRRIGSIYVNSSHILYDFQQRGRWTYLHNDELELNLDQDVGTSWVTVSSDKAPSLGESGNMYAEVLANIMVESGGHVIVSHHNLYSLGGLQYDDPSTTAIPLATISAPGGDTCQQVWIPRSHTGTRFQLKAAAAGTRVRATILAWKDLLLGSTVQD